MKLYADQPARRARQLTGDLLVVGWVTAWVLVGRLVHTTVSRLAAPGRTLETAGTSLEDGLTSAGGSLADVPLVGDTLQAPFVAAGGAAGSIADAGLALQQGVGRAALVTALAVAAWPIVLVVAAWLWARIAFARRAGTVRALLAGGADLELFALRALVRQPLRTLAAVSADPAGDWRRQDPRTVRALAVLELDAAGVTLPSAAAASADGGEVSPRR